MKVNELHILIFSDIKQKGNQFFQQNMADRNYMRIGLFSCEFCKREFTQTSNLSVHLKTKHEFNEVHFCYECDTPNPFGSKSDFLHHKKIHAQNKPFKCDLCEIGFDNLRQLRRHKHSHKSQETDGSALKGESHKCDICEKEFAWKNNLNRHKLAAHKGKEKSVTKHSKNRKENDSKDELKTKSLQGKVKKYKCDVCKKSFGMKSTLTCHIKAQQSTKFP